MNHYNITKGDPLYNNVLGRVQHIPWDEQQQLHARALTSDHPIAQVFARVTGGITRTNDAKYQLQSWFDSNVFEPHHIYEAFVKAINGESSRLNDHLQELVDEEALSKEEAEVIGKTALQTKLLRELWQAQTSLHMLCGGIATTDYMVEQYANWADTSMRELEAERIPVPEAAYELLERVPDFLYTAGLKAAEHYEQHTCDGDSMASTHRSLAGRARRLAEEIKIANPDVKRLHRKDTELPSLSPRQLFW
ncbi:hypothetical protein GF342_04930 [Candidatus Woesearchaeota archaeon]|nr:hypothetical protein [Candidatus Woesearchaeota archaeon]